MVLDASTAKEFKNKVLLNAEHLKNNVKVVLCRKFRIYVQKSLNDESKTKILC